MRVSLPAVATASFASIALWAMQTWNNVMTEMGSIPTVAPQAADMLNAVMGSFGSI
jgi:hypothetical protein|tara:strand:- start:579 stop:746 length:168 start_codon:yes stop_codon:yes gene_type:complete